MSMCIYWPFTLKIWKLVIKSDLAWLFGLFFGACDLWVVFYEHTHIPKHVCPIYVYSYYLWNFLIIIFKHLNYYIAILKTNSLLIYETLQYAKNQTYVKFNTYVRRHNVTKNKSHALHVTLYEKFMIRHELIGIPHKRLNEYTHHCQLKTEWELSI